MEPEGIRPDELKNDCTFLNNNWNFSIALFLVPLAFGENDLSGLSKMSISGFFNFIQ